jgi:RimJ/RimL family protein N-acetyltransferase
MPSPKGSAKPRKPARRSPSRPTPKPKEIKPKPPSERVASSEVRIERVKGTPGKGGDPGGEAWSICVGTEKVGDIYINQIDEPPVGKHASIQIYLNRTAQGRGIGRVAYRLASEASRNDVIYAHMRKINVASRRAAEEAGYVDAALPGTAQLIMKWTRNRK